ncbi:UBP-type zinc finger domain-containing protein [Mycolicibacterium mengxianglii]|uniref:UBP-type zinc finger domain-containing protein n=1 Tax=Mycolicibacterium mengxianglii TaxID=2736649 RepID=UPI0018D159C5|nr:UBP-type zinc finger domain-containing protein [Mycolicibacterium mengxianglii]
MRLPRRRRANRTGRAAGAPGGCAHLVAAAEAGDPADHLQPAQLCQDCATEGISTWAHLRMCVTCGHVGCCDSSSRRHATAHYEATGHPVMRSIEPGERWRWCYVDLELMA